MQGQQTSNDDDGELSLAAEICNSHSSRIVDVPADFLDKARYECDHTHHAATNAVHGGNAQTVVGAQSVQDDKSVAEKADFAKAGTCTHAAPCRVTSIKLLRRRQGADGGNARSSFSDGRSCGTGAGFRKLPGRSALLRSESMVIADTLQRVILTP